MRIRSIKIENIRGIKSKVLSMDLHPNHPAIFVAPNGYGKTSIAVAFKSIKRDRIEVDNDNLHQNDENSAPLVEITDDSGNVYRANSTSNAISDVFSINVINSQVKPKASARSFRGFSAATPSLAVEPIVLYNTIPSRADFSYSHTEMKSRLGASAGKLLLNLKPKLNDPSFVKSISEVKTELARLLQVRNNVIIETFLNEINAIQGTKQSIANYSVDLTRIFGIQAVNILLTEFDFLFHELTENEKIVNLIQLKELYKDNSDNLSNISKYYEYVTDKKEISEMLSFFNCTWKNIKAVKKGSKYSIEFPNANQISNGERDVLCFVGKLFEARNKLRKDKAILIIDEIFDYLDDANLISAQYFLTKFINQFNESGRELFPIILTHLDPMFFNTYSFSTKNIVYLDRVQQTTNKYNINNLLKDRINCRKRDTNLYNQVSSNYLHYSPDNTDASDYLRSLGVETHLLTPRDFYRAAMEELKNYKENRTYDLALVCCGLRIYIEKKVFDQLPTEQQKEFLSIYRTTEKLDYAKGKGASVPEVYFLLSIIYNEAMHLDPQCQKLHPIGYKLKNKVIHNMIREI